MYFRPIWRKKFFTQADSAPSPPQASKREHSECTPKRRRVFGVHSLFSLLLAWGGEGAHSAWVKNFFLPISLKCISWHKDGSFFLLFFFSEKNIKKVLIFLFERPPLCQEMHFRLIGRKKFFTQAEWAPSPPQASKQKHSECPPKRRRVFGVLRFLLACLRGRGGPLCLSEELLPS